MTTSQMNKLTIESALAELDSKHIISRIWKKDTTVWSTDEAHQKIISNGLGWLNVAEMMLGRVSELTAFAQEIREAGFRYVVVLGMGGSSLFPEVMRRTFGPQTDWPELLVLDSTVPAAVQRLDEELDMEKTLFIVASKSGRTTEPQMFYRYYFDRMSKARGAEAGQNFIAITDPNTQLAGEAARDGFRKVFLNPADIGGRYSALSYFGMVPFALMGGDVETLLTRAVDMVKACRTKKVAENAAARIGAVMATNALAGRDKITFITPEPVEFIGLWIEQLIAESTGKEGKGIIPIAGEPLGAPADYGDDRLFVYIHTEDFAPAETEAKLKALEAAGHPVLRHALMDALDLGAEFYQWEFATAVAGHVMGIDPFDQPNVQESKDNTKRLLAEYTSNGRLQEQILIACDDELKVFTDKMNREALASEDETFDGVIHAHLARVKPGDYIAITEYIDETRNHDVLLLELRMALRARTHAATTVGYGPRFLHSTGQLHKGGPDTGVFIQITSEDAEDVRIPDEKFTFGVLKQAQALGDFESLTARNRRAIRLDLGGDIEEGLRRLIAIVRSATVNQ